MSTILNFIDIGSIISLLLLVDRQIEMTKLIDAFGFVIGTHRKEDISMTNIYAL
jgi:hypothetical protein